MDLLTITQIKATQEEIERATKDINIPAKETRLKDLETQSLSETFWSDNNNAKSVMSEIEEIREEIKIANKLNTTANSLVELWEETPEEQRGELDSEYRLLLKEYTEFKRLRYLNGKYDKNNAILSIHSGQGGTEANDWTAILLRMYQRLAERKKWKFHIEHEVQGTEAGLSTVTAFIEGKYVYGFLKLESGTHRLVRISPFNAQNLRQTTFAGVEVMPVIEDNDIDIVIPEADIEFKAVRASGPGGQHVNKTSSAVQIKHIPTGISVHSSEQRSQAQNRETAMKILKAKLWRIEQDKKEAELKQIKGEYRVAGWGNQIRNYVLHPYKLVKDLRTDVQSSNPDAVLDGDLDEFLEAQLLLNS
jgi:peptide chain release factor 2